MYINEWYVMAQSEELTDQPLQVKALGQKFALFRDSHGNAHCLANVCVHRGGSLSSGKIKGDCLQCPYHGLQYDGDGICRFIPTLPEGATIPDRAKVDAYPVDERYGLIFAFLGDLPESERTPILEAPEYDQEGWRTFNLLYHWHANLEIVTENSLDATHAEFAHTATSQEGQFRLGDQASIEMLDYDWGNSYVIRSGSLDLTQGHHGISQTFGYMNFEMKTADGTEPGDFRFYAYATPVDEYSVRRYLLHARNFYLGEENDKQLLKGVWQFENEDRVLLEDTRPLLAPNPDTRQLLLTEDQIIAQYRDFVSQRQQAGWRIDTERVNATREQTVYAIPSPARRESKGWITEEIPRIRPSD